jgi:AhpD family alkylhydroperoxidase
MTQQNAGNDQRETGLYELSDVRKLKLLASHAPEAMQAFVAFDKAALGEGAIPGKYKELIALGVAFTTQCPYCIDIHANKARERGLPIRRLRSAFWSRQRCERVGR